ncbi:hypothetical protein D9M69_629830 [compost metagenome]
MVATAMACQNISGLSFSRPNKIGSEPTGSSVADTKAAMNSVESPYWGSARSARSASSQACIRSAKYRQRSRRKRVGEGPAKYWCLRLCRKRKKA